MGTLLYLPAFSTWTDEPVNSIAQRYLGFEIYRLSQWRYNVGLFDIRTEIILDELELKREEDVVAYVYRTGIGLRLEEIRLLRTLNAMAVGEYLRGLLNPATGITWCKLGRGMHR